MKRTYQKCGLSSAFRGSGVARTLKFGMMVALGLTKKTTETEFRYRPWLPFKGQKTGSKPAKNSPCRPLTINLDKTHAQHCLDPGPAPVKVSLKKNRSDGVKSGGMTPPPKRLSRKLSPGRLQVWRPKLKPMSPKGTLRNLVSIRPTVKVG